MVEMKLQPYDTAQSCSNYTFKKCEILIQKARHCSTSSHIHHLPTLDTHSRTLFDPHQIRIPLKFIRSMCRSQMLHQRLYRFTQTIHVPKSIAKNTRESSFWSMTLHNEAAVHAIFSNFVSVLFAGEVCAEDPDVASVDWDADLAGWAAMVA